jgi:hypothetical protein
MEDLLQKFNMASQEAHALKMKVESESSSDSDDKPDPPRPRVSISETSTLHVFENQRDDMYRFNIAYTAEDRDFFIAKALQDADRITNLITTAPQHSRAESIKGKLGAGASYTAANYLGDGRDLVITVLSIGAKAHVRIEFDDFCTNTMPPTPSPCGNSNEKQVTVQIKTDNYPEETSWTLKKFGNCDGQTDPNITSPTYSTKNTVQSVFQKCVEKGKYQFTISDSYGDGMCCGKSSLCHTYTATSLFIICHIKHTLIPTHLRIHCRTSRLWRWFVSGFLWREQRV